MNREHGDSRLHQTIDPRTRGDEAWTERRGVKISATSPPGLEGIARATRASYSALLQIDARGETLMSPEAVHTILAMISTWGVPILERTSPETERTWVWSDLHLVSRPRRRRPKFPGPAPAVVLDVPAR